jgi:hypothetical protein
MTGFIVSVFPFRNRVSSKEAFEVLELGEGKLSRPVLRGPGGRKAAWLLGEVVLGHFEMSGFGLSSKCRDGLLRLLLGGRFRGLLPCPLGPTARENFMKIAQRQARKLMALSPLISARFDFATQGFSSL